MRWLDKHLNNYKLDEINKIKIDAIKNAKQSEGASNGTVNRMLSLLRAILNRAQLDWEWLDSTPCVRLLPINLNRIRWLTYEEANQLFRELPDHLHAMARFTLATGLRESNVTNGGVRGSIRI